MARPGVHRFRVLATSLVLLVLLRPIELMSGNEQEIRVEQIVAAVNDGYLTVTASFQNLFSKKIIGTIQSGLPSIIQIEIRLLQKGGDQILRKQIVRTISYDIWEERYIIESEDSTEVYTDFEEVKKRCHRIENVPLIAKDRLQSQREYEVKMRVGIVPISARQGDRVSHWLLDPNQTEEDLASEERASGFKLNLSGLISFFVGGKKDSKYVSKWFDSETVHVDQL